MSSHVNYKLERKKKLFAILGTCCERCGEKDLRLLELHHKNEDGAGERINWESDMFYWLIGSILHEHERYATLCGHCHRLNHRKDKGASGPIVITDEERDEILKGWRGTLHEAKNPPEFIKEWVKKHPLEG